MAELEETLNQSFEEDNTGVDVQEETQTPESPEGNTKPQTIEQALNQVQGGTAQQELWKESNQFKNGLWKTPDDVFKSVQFYEKKYQPLEQSIRNMGFKEPSELEQAFKDYQDKLPVYQENENLINTLNALLQNENYGSKLRAAFDEIRKAQEMERYGITFDQLPPIIQERVTKGEQAFQQLEEMKQEQAYNNALGTIQDQMAQIEQIVNDTGLEFDQKAFLEYCKNNNVAPAAMKGEFLSTHYAQMLEKAKQNASLATTTQNKQNKVNAINSSTKQATVQPLPKLNNIYELEQALLNQE